MTEQVWLTDNGVEITPGLRVFTNDWEWGTVLEENWKYQGPTDPGGEHFDGWFRVRLDLQGDEGYRLYNGERMTTSEEHKPDPRKK